MGGKHYVPLLQILIAISFHSTQGVVLHDFSLLDIKHENEFLGDFPKKKSDLCNIIESLLHWGVLTSLFTRNFKKVHRSSLVEKKSPFNGVHPVPMYLITRCIKKFIHDI